MANNLPGPPAAGSGLRYEDVVDELLKRFPEFKETEGFDPEDVDLPYIVWGNFGRYITTYIQRLPVERLDTDSMVERVFAMANDFMASNNDQVNDMVIIELFENFYGSRKTLELARRKLDPQHRDWLERQGGQISTSELRYEGFMIAPEGLYPLAGLLARCSWNVQVRNCTICGITHLEASDERCELAMDHAPGPRYSFYGDLRAHIDRKVACKLLAELSSLLTQGHICHSIRLMDEGRRDQLVKQFEYSGPEWENATPDRTQ